MNARQRVTRTAGVVVVMLALIPATARADQIKVLAATAIEIILREIGPDFERATGHTLTMTVDLAPNFKRRIDAGEAFDVALFSALTIDELVAEGKVRAETRTALLGAGIGVAVRRGAAKPAIGSVLCHPTCRPPFISPAASPQRPPMQTRRCSCIRFLKSPAAVRLIQAKSMTPE